MNTQRLIDSLQRFADILPGVVRHIGPEDARWRPPGGGWSILEIVAHLADEEVEDFRTRVELTLRDPSEPWPPIDPETWAVERRYNEADLEATLDRFVTERHASVEWLRSFKPPSSADWTSTHVHGQLGPLRAGDIFVAWVAHDSLHLRQITKRLFQMTQHDGGDYHADYAGTWTS
ncbi:MAG: DinB family protein [Planctomycetota bacterium]